MFCILHSPTPYRCCSRTAAFTPHRALYADTILPTVRVWFGWFRTWSVTRLIYLRYARLRTCIRVNAGCRTCGLTLRFSNTNTRLFICLRFAGLVHFAFAGCARTVAAGLRARCTSDGWLLFPCGS